MSTKELFIYTWNHDKDEKEITLIRAYGLTAEGETMCLNICDFRPYVYVELPDNIEWNLSKANIVSNKIDEELRKSKPIEKQFILKKRLYFCHKVKTNEGYKTKKFPYLRLGFYTTYDLDRLYYLLYNPLKIPGFGNLKLKVHEKEAGPVLQLICKQDIPSCGWVTFKGKIVEDDYRENYCTEYEVKHLTLKRLDKDLLPFPKVLTFDIEVNSSNPNMMPRYKKPTDKVFQISCILSTAKESKKILLTLFNPTQKIVGEDVEIRKFKTEADLLLGYKNVIVEFQPNILCGYNQIGFDVNYMIKRAEFNYILQDFTKQGFVKDKSCKKMKIKWSSSAFKDQKFKFLDLDGRVYYDMYPIVVRDFKLESYTLKFVSSNFIGETKDPLTHKGIFKCYQLASQGGKKGSRAIALCGKYCVQDSNVTYKLFEKLQTWVSTTEAAKIWNTLPFYVFTKGQQIKVYSQVYKYCYNNNIVVESNMKTISDPCKGATVLDPIPGVHNQVISLDFESLYPSIIIAKNIDYSTLVLDDKIPDEDCNIIEFETHILCEHDTTVYTQKPKKSVCKKYRYRYLKDYPGVIPTIIQNLLAARKAVRSRIRDLDKEKEKDLIDILDKRQLALKISSNSVSPNSPIPCRVNGVFCYKTIEELSCGKWNDIGNEQQESKPIDNLEVWSDIGFTKVKHVLRHPVEGPLVRVVTHTGVVECTEDHSLLRESGKEVKPGHLKYGDRLLHKDTPLPEDTPNEPMFTTISDEIIENFVLKESEGEELSSELAFAWGFFFAEGTCGTYGTLERKKTSFIIYNQNKKLLERVRDILIKYEKLEFKVSDEMYTSMVYHLIPSGNVSGIKKKLADRYRELFYDRRGSKRIPDAVFSSSFYVRQSFFMGYYAGDGNRHIKTGVVIKNKGAIGSAGLNYLARSLGYLTSLNVNNAELYRIQCHTKYRITDTNAIKKMNYFKGFRGVKKLEEDIVRNDTKIEFNKDGNILYRGIEIHCERIVRQKLLNSLDAAIVIANKRNWDILEYHTKGKKIVYKLRCCDKKGTILMQNLKRDINPMKICKCEGVYPSNYNNIEIYEESEEQEYIYDVETESHHFAAGVGSMIVHNSMYGSMAVTKGYLPFMQGGMCVTAVGRQSLLKAKEHIETKLKGKLIYGDSVVGDTPVLIRYPNGNIDVKRIDSLGNGYKWKPYDEFKAGESNRKDKQQQDDVDFEVWASGGWVKVQRVIRHHTTKSIYRISTPGGVVDVTEDHSLLNEYGKKIKPTELHKGDKLLQSFPLRCDFKNKNNNFDLEEEISSDILNESYGVRFSYYTKYCKEFGIKDKFVFDDTIKSQIFYTLLRSLGFENVYVKRVGEEYILTIVSILKNRNCIESIEKIYENVNDYVYDLETSCGKFNCGVGEITVSNTDSTYVSFPQFKTSQEIWDNALRVEKELRTLFPPPMGMAFEEKIFWKFMILTKKRYMWLECKRDGIVSEKLGKKGVMLARRDYSKVVKDIYMKIVMDIFNGSSMTEILETLVEWMNKLCSGYYNYKEFVITKSVKEINEYKIRPLPTDPIKKMKRLADLGCTENEYMHKALPAHVQLAEIMRRRGIRVDAGQRLGYIVRLNPDCLTSKEENLFDQIEDPDYFKEHSDILKIDYLYYVHMAIAQVDQVLDAIFGKDKNVFLWHSQPIYTLDDDSKKYKKFMEWQYKIRKIKQEYQFELQSYFRPKVHYLESGQKQVTEYFKKA